MPQCQISISDNDNDNEISEGALQKLLLLMRGCGCAEIPHSNLNGSDRPASCFFCILHANVNSMFHCNCNCKLQLQMANFNERQRQGLWSSLRWILLHEDDLLLFCCCYCG